MSGYTPLSSERTQLILEHLAQLPKWQPVKDARLGVLLRQFIEYADDCSAIESAFHKVVKSSHARPGRRGVGAGIPEGKAGMDIQARASRTFAYVIALGLSSELDDLLPKVVGQGKRRSKTFLGRYQLLGAKQLDEAMRPSTKRELDWPRGLLKVFGVKWDDLISEGLKDLAGARSSPVHELPREMPDFWFSHIQLWQGSATWLLYSLVLHLDDLIARGR